MAKRKYKNQSNDKIHDFYSTDFFTDEEKQDMLKSGQRPPFNPGPITESSKSFTKEDWDKMHKDERSELEKLLGTENYNRLKDRPDFTGENAIEFFDIVGSSSWNDALQAHETWHKSGRTYPTFGEGVEMFGAIPGLGKLGRFSYFNPNSIRRSFKKFPWQKIINRADSVEDEIAKSESIQPTKPGTLSKEVKKSLPKYQDGDEVGFFESISDLFFGKEEAELPVDTVPSAPLKMQKDISQLKPDPSKFSPDSIAMRQVFMESGFDPKAKSGAGAYGYAQIMPSVKADYIAKTGDKNVDETTIQGAEDIRRWYMDDLYNASFINKPGKQNDETRLLKTLAAYNWGRGHMLDYLTDQKRAGVNIYDDQNKWIEGLPPETSQYLERIYFKDRTEDARKKGKEFEKAIADPKYKNVVDFFENKKSKNKNGGPIPKYQMGANAIPLASPEGMMESENLIREEQEVLDPDDYKQFKHFNDFIAEDSAISLTGFERELREMHKKSGQNCLAGALNCQRDLVSYKLGMPSVRQMIENTGIHPIKWEGSMKSRNPQGRYEHNNSLDSWEMANFLLENDLATEWRGDFSDPEQRKTIPLGSLAFQGRSDSNYGGTRKQYTQEPSQRHTASSIRFNDEGEILFYDFGDLEGGEDLMYPTEVERIIIPKGYENFTYDKLKRGHQKYIEALGYPEDYTPEEETYDLDAINTVMNSLNEAAKPLAGEFSIPKRVMDKLINVVPGIGVQESQLSYNVDESQGGWKSQLGKVKYYTEELGSQGKNIKQWAKVGSAGIDAIEQMFSKNDERPSQPNDWVLEMLAYDEETGELDKEKFNQLRDEYSKTPEDLMPLLRNFGSELSNLVLQSDESHSVGPFSIKYFPEAATKLFGIEKDDLYGTFVTPTKELERGSKAALTHLAENYKKYKNKYKDLNLTEDELINIAVVAYNNVGKANSKEFVDFYIKNRKLPDNYLSRVKGFSDKYVKKKGASYQYGGEIELEDNFDSVFGNALQTRTPKLPKNLHNILENTPDRDAEVVLNDYFTDDFNTELTPDEYQHFLIAVEEGIINPRDIGVYDIQGYWKSGLWNNNTDPDNHGTDTFKKPSHPTFSGESMYSAQQGGSEFIGGQWRPDGGFIAGPDNFYSNDRLMWEFGREPNRPEYLYMGTPRVDIVAQGTPVTPEGFLNPNVEDEVILPGNGEEIPVTTEQMTEPIKVTGSDGKSEILEPGVVEEFKTPVLEEKIPNYQNGGEAESPTPVVYDWEDFDKFNTHKEAFADSTQMKDFGDWRWDQHKIGATPDSKDYPHPGSHPIMPGQTYKDERSYEGMYPTNSYLVNGRSQASVKDRINQIIKEQNDSQAKYGPERLNTDMKPSHIYQGYSGNLPRVFNPLPGTDLYPLWDAPKTRPFLRAKSKMESEERPVTDIKMPDGTIWSKEKFINRFGEKKWKEETKSYNRKRSAYQKGANVLSHRDSVAHQADKILKYEQLQGGPGGRPLPSYSDPRYKAMLMDDIYPEINKIMPNASAIEKGEAMDYVFNAGWDKSNKAIKRDPRAYALQEYYRKYDRSQLDKDGNWAGRRGAPYSFDYLYNETIGKLPENERRVLMNKGRDWYYQNINTKPDGSPSDNYKDTWYGRIWNTNDFSEFNSNNPKFRPR